jgi:hypothetical protein
MLEGLDGVGLVGLALTPEVLRHPITAAAPLLAPSDFRGATIAIRPSRTTEAVMHALGTTTRIDNGPRLVTGIEGRSIKGFEGQLVTAAPFSYSDLVATGNITFSVKALAVIVNRRVWNSLYDSQRDVLRRAALEARDWWIANRPTDVQLGRLWCKQGGTIAQASPAELAALERVTVPVTTGLEQDPFTAKAIQRIRELKRGLGPQPAVAACGTHPANHVAPVPQRGDQSVLDGRWRVRVSRTELRAAGVSEEEASQTGGTWTLTIGDARVAAVRRASGGTTRCDASIFIRGARLSLVWDPGSACKDDLDGTFARTGDTIRIVPTAPAGHAVRFNSAFFGHGMQLLRLRP